MDGQREAFTVLGSTYKQSWLPLAAALLIFDTFQQLKGLGHETEFKYFDKNEQF
jgi:hypothetical protein